MQSVLFLIGLVSYTSGLIVRGSINSETKWRFLGRFCFKSTVGQFAYKVKLSGGYNNITSLIPYSEEQWPTVYPEPEEPLSCREKVAVIDPSSPYIANFDFSRYFSGCSLTQEAIGTEIPAEYTCSAAKTFPASTREKWWYIAIQSCAHPKGLVASYELTMTNDKSNFFFRHYSADEFYILQIDIVFLVLYILMSILSFFVAYSLKQIQMYHTTYQVYMGSLLLEMLSLCVLVGYWAEYGRTGEPNTSVRYLGHFLELWSSIMFIVVLILMAKGYTVTRSWISTAGKIKMAVFVGCYILTAIAVFVVDAVSYDPGLVIYIYDSIPGYVLIALKFIAWLWFLYGLIFTFKNFPEKRLFYIPFTIFYSVWFLVGPITTISAIYIPAWMREKTVNGVNLSLILLGHIAFMWITWPSQANKNFPFTVKRTTINVDENDPANVYANGQDAVAITRRDHNMFTATSSPANN